MLDKRSRNILILFGVVLLFLIITEATRPKAINWSPSYTSNDTAPFGSDVFYKELPSLYPNATFETVEEDPYEFLRDTTAYKTNTAYMFINDYIYFDEEQRDKIRAYVAAGNSVFISSSTNYYKVNDSVKIESRRVYNQQEEELRPELFTQSYKADSSLFYKKGMYKTTFYEIDTLNTKALGYYKSENPATSALNFVKLKHGEGYFYFHTVPEAFSNYYMLKGNEAYTAAVLSHIDATHIYLDAYKKSGRKVVTSPMRFVFNQVSLTWAYYLLLGGLLLFVIFRGKREQRIIEVIEPLENTSIEFTKTIGDLYFQHKDYGNIIAKKITYFLESVRTNYYLKTDTLDASFIKRLALKSGHTEEETQKLIQLIKHLKGKAMHIEADLIELNKKIEAFRL